MRVDIVKLFRDCVTAVRNCGRIGKELGRQIANVHFVNARYFTTDKHRKVDDEAYGGVVGMLMKPGPIFSAVESLPTLQRREVIMMSPQGETINQPLLRELAGNYDQIVIICGHYEGVDERVLELVTREVSLGDFILTGGEIPSMALINGVGRLLPGTVGKAESLKLESFEEGLLDFPQYTRPATLRDHKVPDVLLSGNHAAIARWRYVQQIDRTRKRRPDLFKAWGEEKRREGGGRGRGGEKKESKRKEEREGDEEGGGK